MKKPKSSFVQNKNVLNLISIWLEQSKSPLDWKLKINKEKKNQKYKKENVQYEVYWPSKIKLQRSALLFHFSGDER